MKLYEFEGADLFEQYEIPVPKRQVITSQNEKIGLSLPLVVKAQLLTGDRKKAGGIVFVEKEPDLKKAVASLLGKNISNQKVEKILVAEKIQSVGEYYVSFSFDSASRTPVLALSAKGGSGIADAHLFPIDMILGLQAFFVREALFNAGFPSEDILPVSQIIMKLWKLFTEEKLTVAEINPLLKTKAGDFYACDSKVDYGKRRTVERMDGDIAVIASGGGASLINMDALLMAGGKPANYAEYSGNPGKEVASFTDIYETMKGFLEGLKEVKPKPQFPFVIRRDGPRAKEAQKLLADFAKKEGFEFYIYGSETPMVGTAQVVVDLAYKNKKPAMVS